MKNENHNPINTVSGGKGINRRIILGVVVVAILVVGILWGWTFLPKENIAQQQTNVDEQRVIKIGAILPLTGNYANIGQENKAGIEVALEEVNKNGKLIDVVYEDSRGDSKTSLSAMRKLEMQGVNKVILSTTATAAPVLEKYKNDTFFFSVMSQKIGILSGTNNAIRIYLSSENETNLMAKYILNNHFKKIATLSANVETCLEPVKTTKQKLLIENPSLVFYEQTFESSDRDFRTEFATIKKFNPDVLLITAYPDQWEQIIRQLTEQQMNFPIIANSGFGLTAENDFYKDLNVMNMIVFPAPYFVLNKEQPFLKQIISDLKDKYNIDANFNVLYSYDNISIMFKNIKHSDNNIEFMRSICSKEYQGATGRIAFDYKHDIKQTELTMVKIVNGKYNDVKY
ncbi:MAG: penicillin-binding protein activator [Desulfobulbaceae bacterium]|nr:penicillin-binding protein activator [Desulfobulbaceae bacterium]